MNVSIYEVDPFDRFQPPLLAFNYDSTLHIGSRWVLWCCNKIPVSTYRYFWSACFIYLVSFPDSWEPGQTYIYTRRECKELLSAFIYGVNSLKPSRLLHYKAAILNQADLYRPLALADGRYWRFSPRHKFVRRWLGAKIVIEIDIRGGSIRTGSNYHSIG